MGVCLSLDPEEEKAQKRLKSLLNKITKDNFARITAQVRGVRGAGGMRWRGCWWGAGGRVGDWKVYPRP